MSNATKKQPKLLAPSILSADFAALGDEVRAVDAAGADWIHVDVMDGHFVPTITIGPLVVSAVRTVTQKPLDVHLMIENPDRYIADFIRAGADWVSVQQETCPHLDRTLSLIRSQGAHPGVVLNPATPLETIEWVLDTVEYVLLMSVNPGFGGQSFIPHTLQKIAALAKIRHERGLEFLIEVDGGIKPENIAQISAAGTDVFVAGSAIFGTSDYRAVMAQMKAMIQI